MSVVLQNLLEITRKRVVSESDLDYFEEHVEDFPDNWGNLYLWSIQSKNYQLSDYLLESGLDLNINEDVRRDVINSYSLFGLYSEKIIQDGFDITKDIYHLIINIYSNDKYFERDRIEKDFNYCTFRDRERKILKIKVRISRKI